MSYFPETSVPTNLLLQMLNYLKQYLDLVAATPSDQIRYRLELSRENAEALKRLEIER